MNTKLAIQSLGVIAITAASGVAAQTYEVTRLCGGPILTSEHFQSAGAPESEGANLNGPTLIRLPEWLEPERRADPKAEYYLYFAHHHGGFIRLAWASELCGPWRLYAVGGGVEVGARGVLDLGADDTMEVGNGLQIVDHLASPEIVIDDARKRFIMYFHGRVTHEGVPVAGQHTFVATSDGGLDFNGLIKPVMLGNSYFRVFNKNGQLYAIANSSSLYRAPSSAHPWEPPPGFDFATDLWTKRADPLIPFEANPRGGPMLPRHSWVWPRGDELWVLFTRVGDVPERIVVVSVDARDADFGNWKPLPPVQDLLRAELPWEGGNLEPAPSAFDWAPEPVNQLRDPFVFQENEKTYLLYAGAGENAIGIAELSAK